MYVIIQRENCPERYMGEVYGPYPLYDEAAKAADLMDEADWNGVRNGQRKWTHDVHPLQRPEDAL